MKHQRGFITEQGVRFMYAVLIALGLLAGFLLFVVAPWLWSLLRPWFDVVL